MSALTPTERLQCKTAQASSAWTKSIVLCIWCKLLAAIFSKYEQLLADLSAWHDLLANNGSFLWKQSPITAVHCTMCCLGSMFSFQPNKLRHILKFMSWYIIQHIFVPACSVGRKTWFSRKPWLSNSKFGISGSFWPILSVPKIMFLLPENEMQNKFSSFLPKRT